MRGQKIAVHKKHVKKLMKLERAPKTIKEYVVDSQDQVIVDEFPGIVVLKPMSKDDLDLLAVMFNCPVWYIPNGLEADSIPVIQAIPKFIKSKLEPHVRYPAIQPRKIRKAC